MPELIADGETGILCDSIEAMGAAIDIVDRIDPLACRRRAEQLFSIETARDNYLRLYERRLSGDCW
jgi:glycosyltransferase involved in cell wall biosynthesis